MKKIGFILMITLTALAAESWAQPAEIIPGVPLRVYNCSLGGMTAKVQRGSQYELYINVENPGKEVVEEVEFMIQVPEGITIVKNKQMVLIERVKPRYIQCVNYAFAISTKYAQTSIPISIWMSDDKGTLKECYEASIAIGSPVLDPVPVVRVPERGNATAQYRVLREPEEQTSGVVSTARPTDEKTVVSTDEDEGLQVYEVTGSSVNVRSAPNTSRSIVDGKLRKGETVEGREVNSGWVNIKYRGKSSYVAKAYLKKIEKHAAEELSVVENDVSVQEDVQSVPSRSNRPPSSTDPSRTFTGDDGSASMGGGFSPGTSFAATAKPAIRKYFLPSLGFQITKNDVWGLNGGFTFGLVFAENVLFATGFYWVFYTSSNTDVKVEGNYIRLPLLVGFTMGEDALTVSGGIALNYVVNSRGYNGWVNMSKVDDRTSWSALVRISLTFFYYQCNISFREDSEAVHEVGICVPLN